MEWFLLIVGGILLCAGIVGQIVSRPKIGHLNPEDRRARRWVLTLVSLMVGVWLIAVLVAHLISLGTSGHW